MLDIKYLRENLTVAKKALAKRGEGLDLDAVLELEKQRRLLLQKVEKTRAQKNQLAQSAPSSAVMQKSLKLKERIKKQEAELKEVEELFYQKLASLPNLPHPSVPDYKEGTRIEKKWGQPRTFLFSARSHEELGEILDVIDIVRAGKVSGSRMGYLKNEAAFLEFALVRYLLDKLTKKGFIPMVVPVLVKERAMFGTGFFPTEKIEYYKMAEDDLYLAGTAEVALCAYHTDEILDEEKLPLRYLGFSSCFRREAGSYGRDTHGLFRVHQFDKVEMFVFASERDSWEEFEQLQNTVEEIMKDLQLPFQVVNIPANDLGAPNAKKYDTEVWFPSQKRYRELTSCSHDTDFQARRLNIRYRHKDGSLNYVHTLNSTASAIGRTIIALLENHQQEDGSVLIPKALQKYTGFAQILPKERK